MKSLLKISLYGLVEYFMVFPLLILGGFYLHGSQLSSWLVFTFLLYLLGGIIQLIIKKEQLIFQFLIALCMGIPTAFLFDYPWIVSIIHVLIVFRGYSFAVTRQILPLNYLWFGGLGIYIVSYIAFIAIDSLEAWKAVLTSGGVVYVIAVMFITNQHHLYHASLSKQPTLTKAMKRQNQLAIALIGLLILLLSYGKALQQLLWNGFRSTIIAIIHLLSGNEKEEVIFVEEPTAPPMDFSQLGEMKEPSKIAVLLEKIFMYGAMVLLVLAFVFLLLYSIKNTRTWVKNLIQKVKQLLSRLQFRRNDVGTEEYTDETENLFDFKEWRKEGSERIKDWVQAFTKRPVNWHSLTNEQKVREIYKQFVKGNLAVDQFKSSDTPRQTVEKISHADRQRIVETYEKTRYGEQELNDEVIEEISQFIKK